MTFRNVRLYGDLGKKFGKCHRLDVRTPGEAVRALCANYPEFERHLSKAHERKVGFRIVVGKKYGIDDAKQLNDPISGSDIAIIPDVIGRKENGIGQILVGIVILVAAFYTGGGSLAGMGSGFAGAMTGVGVSLVLGGVAQLLSPQPKMGESKEARKPSYTIDGAVNTMAQGHPVPIGYGRMIVGSAVISARMSVEQLLISSDTSTSNIIGNGTYPIPSTAAPTVWFNNQENRWEDMSCVPLIADMSVPSGFRTSDGKPLVLDGTLDRWEIQGATVSAIWNSTTGNWMTRRVRKNLILVLQPSIALDSTEKRFEGAYVAADFTVEETSD